MDAQTAELPDPVRTVTGDQRSGWTSILFRDEASAAASEEAQEPDCFRDLRLDSIVDAVARDYAEFRLKPFFHSPLAREADVRWRQEIVRDFQKDAIADALKAFAASQARMRAQLASEAAAYHALQKLHWRFDAMANYADGVATLVAALTKAAPGSEGLRNGHGALIDYVASPGFQQLWSEATDLATRLHAIRYSIRTEGAYVEVGRFTGGRDYGAEVEALFARFRQADGRAPDFAFEPLGRMTQLEEQILERVALLNQPLFADLERFCREHGDFADPIAERLDRELHFYLSYLEFSSSLRGLSFSLPEVTDKKAVRIEGGFDLALAASFGPDNLPVRNDFRLSGEERMAVVTGPNQGGKTTFVRMVGQISYLARLGLPVPAARAELFLGDAIFTHFERQESITGPGGKLHDDLVRIHSILERATERSIVILNEIFTSTTVEDADRLSRAVATKILGRDMLCLWVTFLEDLASLNAQTTSIVAEVSPDDPAVRTYRLERRPPDGLAHAIAIARKYGLTRERLNERLER